MKQLKIPEFGEACVYENRENTDSCVFLIPDASEARFDAYDKLLTDAGYVKREEYRVDTHRFAAFEGESGEGVFLNYYGATRELNLVTETNCRYFSYCDEFRGELTQPQITQIMLEDFGFSYAVRLSDGRFIVFDGGRNFEPDQDRLYQCLKEGSPDQTPIIAAWVMTHPHSDHFHCFLGFMDRYGDRVKIERFLLNFPDADDLAHYPKLAHKDPRFEDNSGCTNVPLMWERIDCSGAEVYTVHTGQRYRIGDAACEILSCMDDTIHCSQNINATSVVIRMELGGQVILWAADASFSDARIPERYGTHLKADILQVPHHGFQCGTAEAEIRGYQLIRPKVCLLPASDYTAFTYFCTHKEGAHYLMTRADVDEIITGTVQRTLTLPYTAPAYAKHELQRQYLSGRDNCGVCTWIYSELSTSCPEDFQFTLLNTANRAATVWIDLFFEDPKERILFIKAEVGAARLKRIDVSGADVDRNALYFNWMSGNKPQQIPSDVPFAVRFISDTPIVVSHRSHTASYHGENR